MTVPTTAKLPKLVQVLGSSSWGLWKIINLRLLALQLEKNLWKVSKS